MSVRKFRASWWVDFRWKGTRYRKRSLVNTRAGAHEYETVLRGRLARNEPVDGVGEKTQVSFADLAKTWMATHSRTNNRPSTVRDKECILAKYLLPYFGRKALEEISALEIERYKGDRLRDGLSPKTVNNHLTVLRASLMKAAEWSLLQAVPFIHWLKTAPPKDNFYTEDECDRLVGGAEDSLVKDMIVFALHTGMRRGEIIALDWEDVNLEQGMISVRHSIVRGILGAPKSNRTRVIPMTPVIKHMLSACARKSGLVFPGREGTAIAEATMAKYLQRACRQGQVRSVGWHVLRHTFASHLVQRGVPIRAVQELLGHSSVKTTERYAHLGPSSLREAVLALMRPRVQSTSDLGHVTSSGAYSESEPKTAQ